MELNQNIWDNLLTASQNGDADAQNDLATWFEEGYHDSNFEITKDLKQAAFWYIQSAESGNADSQDSISRLYSLGQGVEQDIVKSIEWALKSIEQGNPIAAYNLATVYRDEMNFDMAFDYYSLAFEMGEKSALLQIGLCYYFGLGTTINYKKAISRFVDLLKEQQVAEYEIDEANYWIGFSHLTGNGTLRSIDLARDYFQKANINKDHEPSQLMLNLIGRKYC